MPDPTLMPAIEAALKANEGGQPYALSFAGKGSSGASFGLFQADTAANPNALATLRAVLAGAGMDPGQMQGILAAVSVPCPVDPLSPADLQATDAALSSPQGRALVDALDDHSLARVGADLDLATNAASAAGASIATAGQLAICLWCNMSGAPTMLLTWLGGSAVNEPGGNVAPPGNPVTLDDVQRYLSDTGFFTAHPQNLAHFTASVAVGEALAP